MKINYKGFDVDAHKAKSMGGDVLIYYGIFRISDGYEVMSGFSYGTDKIRDFIFHLKGVVDDFLEDPQAYYKEPFGFSTEELDDAGGEDILESEEIENGSVEQD